MWTPHRTGKNRETRELAISHFTFACSVNMVRTTDTCKSNQF